MGLNGSLETVGLPDVLQLISGGSMTGTLEISRPGETRRLFFQDGNLLHATSSVRRGRVLDLLVAGGSLSPEQAEKILARAAKEGSSAVTILAQRGLVTQEQLMAAVAEGAREIVCELFQWLDGNFSFIEGQLPESDLAALSVSLSTYNLIMEGARRIDEWSRIRQALPSMSTVLELHRQPDAAEIQLERSEWELLALVDGRRTVRQICQAVKRSDFETCRMLYGLLTSGLIRVSSCRPGPAATVRAPWWRSRMGVAGLAASGLAVVSTMVGLSFQAGRGGQEQTPPMATPVSPVVSTTVAAPQATEIPLPPTSNPTSIPTPVSSPVPEPEPTAKPPVRDHRIDLNQASVTELQSLPRVGPATANRIVADRDANGPFRSTREITRVPGIGEKTYQRLQDLITVAGGGEPAASRPAAEPRQQAPAGPRININTASSLELQSLPRIGPATAAKIVAYREEHGPFLSPRDLTLVKGIGEKTFLGFEDQIIVGP